VQALARQHYSGFDQFLVEFAHFAKDPLVWQCTRLGLLGRFDHYHDFHRPISPWMNDFESAVRIA
jgi:hypothetical protein